MFFGQRSPWKSSAHRLKVKSGTDEYNVMVKNEELIGTTEYLMVYERCPIDRCYNWVLLYVHNLRKKEKNRKK
jgi:hypothetical protein